MSIPFAMVRVSFALVLMLPLVGCGDGDDATAPEPQTIEEFLEGLRTAYLQGDVATHQAMLASDFVFRVDPEDREGYEDIPASWGRDLERESLQRLHGHEDFVSLRLGFSAVTFSEPDSADGDFPDAVIRAQFRATVNADMQYAGTDEWWSASGNGDQRIFLREVPDRRRGQPAWEVVEWRERRDGFDGAQIIPSWGVFRVFFSDSSWSKPSP